MMHKDWQDLFGRMNAYARLAWSGRITDCCKARVMRKIRQGETDPEAVISMVRYYAKHRYPRPYIDVESIRD